MLFIIILSEEKPMGKNTFKISIIVGIIFLFLSTTCLPVLANEGKPDLTIISMGFSQHDDYPGGPDTDVYATVQNIGDANSDPTISIYFQFRRVGSPWSIVSTSVTDAFYALEPGEWIGIHLMNTDSLPYFGLFWFRCKVHSPIPENNIDNNWGTRMCVALFGYWSVIAV